MHLPAPSWPCLPCLCVCLSMCRSCALMAFLCAVHFQRCQARVSCKISTSPESKTICLRWVLSFSQPIAFYGSYFIFFNLTLHTVRCDYPLMLECEWWPHNWTKLLEIAFNVSALWRESCSPLFCFKWQISPPTSFQFNTTVTRRTFSIEVLNILK